MYEVSSRAFLSLEMGYSHMQYLFSVDFTKSIVQSQPQKTALTVIIQSPVRIQVKLWLILCSLLPANSQTARREEKIWFKLFPEYLIIFCSTLVTLSGVTGGPFNDKAHSLRTAEGIMTGPAAQLFDYKYILWCTSWFEKCVGHFVLLCGCKWQLH